MKIKNKTNTPKELTDLISGKRILVDGKKTIELDRASFNTNAFEIVKEKVNIEQKEEIKNCKEVI